jgi:aryl-alcohol dehydrogenase-like predicted oxidoreductase
MFEPPWPGCVGIGGGSGKAARDWYAANDVALFPWSSLAGGFLTGRFTRDNIPQEGYHDGYCKKAYCRDENFQRLDRVQILAKERGLSIAQIALAWTFSLPLNVVPLVGRRNADELAQNIAALNEKLTPEEVEWLNLERDSR